jgi:hypothetical protein
VIAGAAGAGSAAWAVVGTLVVSPVAATAAVEVGTLSQATKLAAIEKLAMVVNRLLDFINDIFRVFKHKPSTLLKACLVFQ